MLQTEHQLYNHQAAATMCTTILETLRNCWMQWKRGYILNFTKC